MTREKIQPDNQILDFVHFPKMTGVCPFWNSLPFRSCGVLTRSTTTGSVIYKMDKVEQIEIVVEGKSAEVQAVEPRKQARSTHRAATIARVEDPVVIARVLDQLNRHGSLSTIELRRVYSDEYNRSLGSDHARNIRTELQLIRWVNLIEERWTLTPDGKVIAEEHPIQHPVKFALALCLRHEEYNQQVMTRLLERLYRINPRRDGAVIIPTPPLDSAPLEWRELKAWLLQHLPKWHEQLVHQMSGFSASLEPEQLANVIVKRLESKWGKNRESERHKRLQEVIADRFLEFMFEDICSPTDANYWQGRMAWAGLTMTARDLPGVAGRVWFPVGTFRSEPAPDYTRADGLQDSAGLLFHIYTPSGPEIERRFADALYEGYLNKQREEQVEYVSLLSVRDWVCYQLRIGNPIFESLLQQVFPQAVRGQFPYALSLEVDRTPGERQLMRGALPVVVDSTPRYIIAMKRRYRRLIL